MRTRQQKEEGVGAVGPHGAAAKARRSGGLRGQAGGPVRSRAFAHEAGRQARRLMRGAEVSANGQTEGDAPCELVDHGRAARLGIWLPLARQIGDRIAHLRPSAADRGEERLVDRKASANGRERRGHAGRARGRPYGCGAVD